jgi:transcriptional regulator with XRE-family HTH domain
MTNLALPRNSLVVHKFGATFGLCLCMTSEQELEALKDWPEPQVCMLLAARVRRARVAGEESQADFAERAGVPLRTYKRFELDGKGTLLTFIQILRALGRTQYLTLIFPAPLPPPRPTVDTKLTRARALRLLEMARMSDAPVKSFYPDTED